MQLRSPPAGIFNRVWLYYSRECDIGIVINTGWLHRSEGTVYDRAIRSENMNQRFETKSEARQFVWDALEQENAARFPFPPHGRIPNFAGAEQAAKLLLNQEIFRGVQRVKINPDAPQRFIREGALRRGMTVYMPTPRLRAGFQKFDPDNIPGDRYSEAATLSKGKLYAEQVDLGEIPAMDLVVAGSVAVTRDGKRCGKGHGYSDLEYAILRELGHDEIPVVTTVHPIQVVEDFPADLHDLSLSVIATPEEIIGISDPPPAPKGIDWSSVRDQDLQEMPVLQDLKELKS